MDISIGSSGGTTLVRIATTLRKSLRRSRVGSASPSTRTVHAAATANARSTRRNVADSRESAVTRSPAKRIVRVSSPCDVANPVRSTTATHPSSPASPRAVDTTLVPPNSTCCLSAGSRSASSGSLDAIENLRAGSDSPVSIASVTVASPATNNRSHGKTAFASHSCSFAPESRRPPLFFPPTETRTTSPGTSAAGSSSPHLPSRLAERIALVGSRRRMSRTVRRRFTAVRLSHTTSMARVHSE